MIDYNELAVDIHKTAKEKGWWDRERSKLTIGTLIIGEISEAVEEVRKHNPDIYQIHIDKNGYDVMIKYTDNNWNNNIKPEGEAIEIVDMLIQLLDYYQYQKEKGLLKVEIIHSNSNYIINYDFKDLDYHGRAINFITKICFYNDIKMINELIYLTEKYFDYKGWNLEELLKLKINYNKTRSHRHGGKKY